MTRYVNVYQRIADGYQKCGVEFAWRSLADLAANDDNTPPGWRRVALLKVTLK